jgi:alpha-glucosidase
MTTPMLLNLGLSGFGVSGADVGGFAGTPQPDLLTKWLEIAAFQPIDRDHTAKDTGDQEPWVHGLTHEFIRRRFIEERYRLLPYLYTTAEEMSRNGMPIVRPLFLDFPNATPDGHPIDLDAGGEFLFGPDILVAPPAYPDMLDPYEVKLPPGDWYDYWTGAFAAHITGTASRDAEQPLSIAPHPLLITPTVESLPVYVRGGAIIPIQPLVQSTDEKPQGPLTLRVYAPTAGSSNSACRGTLYQDDGISFAFRTGAFLRIDSTCERTTEGLRVHIGRHEGTFQPWWRDLRIEVYGWTSTTSTASANNQPVPSTSATGAPLAVTLPDPGTGIDLLLK